jgi:hypothetical protein
MYRVISRKLVAYSRATLPPSRRRKFLVRASRLAGTAGAGILTGLVADAVVHQHGLSFTEVDLDVKEALITTILSLAIRRVF